MSDGGGSGDDGQTSGIARGGANKQGLVNMFTASRPPWPILDAAGLRVSLSCKQITAGQVEPPRG